MPSPPRSPSKASPPTQERLSIPRVYYDIPKLTVRRQLDLTISLVCRRILPPGVPATSRDGLVECQIHRGEEPPIVP